MGTNIKIAQPAHQPVPAQGVSAHQLQDRQRRMGWNELHALFRSGSTPRKLAIGDYAGRFEAFNIAPGITQLAELVARTWMPWQGKQLHPAQSLGYNILTNDSFGLVRLAAPSYRKFVTHGSATYCAFPFQTYIAPGHRDPDMQVLKIDYDLPDNPGLSVRRLQDELVQIDNNLYLGKAYFKWWGAWQLWAYFSLRLPQTEHAAV